MRRLPAPELRPCVLEAALRLTAGIDPASVGGAVTVELCGHWEHDGVCRWPHNNDIDVQAASSLFRTLFVAAPTDEALVRARIERALRRATGVEVHRLGARPPLPTELPLATRLLHYARSAE